MLIAHTLEFHQTFIKFSIPKKYLAAQLLGIILFSSPNKMACSVTTFRAPVSLLFVPN